MPSNARLVRLTLTFLYAVSFSACSDAGSDVDSDVSSAGHDDDAGACELDCHAEANCVTSSMGFVCECEAGLVGDGFDCQPADTQSAQLSINEISMFQVVEVGFVDNGREVSPSNRLAPLIADRDVRLRAHVDVGEGWNPAMVGAKLEVHSGGEAHTFTTDLHVSSSTDTSDPRAGFHIDIPAAVITPDAKFSLKLGPGEESRMATRFPAEGTASLGVVRTGPIHIHLLPFEVEGFVPDTSKAVIEGYRDAVMAVYPTSAVHVTVGDVVPDLGISDLGDLLVEVGEVQQNSDAAPEVYYYGMATGVASREEFTGITGSSQELFDRAGFAIGAAFGDQRAEDTLIHELGHLHLLQHAPCGNAGNTAADFPQADGSTGVEGYDFRTRRFVETNASDMMGYCYPRWISAFHYNALVAWVQQAQDWSSSLKSESFPSQSSREL